MNVYRSRLKALSVISLFALSVPSAASAWDNYEEQPDQIISVTVDATPGGDQGENNQQLCTGFSTISVSTTNPSSSLQKALLGSENPTIQQRLQRVNLSLTAMWNGNYIFDPVLDAYAIDEQWALDNSYIAGLLDTTNDGLVGSDDASLARYDNFVYASEPFEITYDANSCIDSWDAADVYVERTPVEARILQNNAYYWSDIDFPVWNWGMLQDGLESGMVLAGNAYLVRNTQIGGQTWTRDFAYEPGFLDGDNIVLSGQQGTTSLRAVTELYGSQINSQIRTQYGVWLMPYLD